MSNFAQVYPLFVAVGAAVGICGFQLVRNICINPEVRSLFFSYFSSDFLKLFNFFMRMFVILPDVLWIFMFVVIYELVLNFMGFSC